jgi:hypothetical protein
MVTVSELQAWVSSDFDRLHLRSWPDPHPDRSPAQEEYSRVTDPGRYAVVHARAGVWAAVLEEALGVRSDPLAPSAVAGADRPEAFHRGVQLTARRPGTLPLLLLERDVPTRGNGYFSVPPTGDATLALLNIGVVRPDVVVETQPDCGCDACDSGSIDLLEAIDATIRSVVGGPFVAMRGNGWRAHWHPEGGSANSGRRGPSFDTLMDACRRLANGEAVRLPKDAEAFVGRSWLA